MSNKEKPPIDKVTLVPDQALTPQEKQECVTFLTTYEPKIHWEVGHRVNAYLGTKIISLYIRSIDPRNRFFGYLGETGEIDLVDHQQIGEPPKQTTPIALAKPITEPTQDPILVIHRVPPNADIEIKIKSTKD